ncbi:MAG: exodeoxyribonuclease VII small subunit [Faecalibacterium sp.]|nr:exodeoxyribonuclease VII small subunit [Faecalibacterium sp.]
MKTPKNFEAAIARLEELLAKISDEATPLADTVKLYAEAAALIEYCNTTLDNARQEVEQIDARLAAGKQAGEE